MNLKNGTLKILLKSLRPLAPVADVLLFPLSLLAILWFRLARFWGIRRLKITQWLFLRFGMLPVVDHYYEPLIDYRKVPVSPVKTHLDLDDARQLDFIKNFDFQESLKAIPLAAGAVNEYHYHNGAFGSGDGELYYSIIRYYQPQRILEVGSGFSTLMALKAIDQAQEKDPSYACSVTCIEPYEMPFLDQLKVRLIRQRVEQIDPEVFSALQRGDILFIDSSHIIRPGGDVNFIILHVLPTLNAGVLIHFHDIFIPQHYPAEWLKDEYRLWNEQYLLEAFLLNNDSFEIVLGLAYMKLNHRSVIEDKFPVLKTEPERLPGSIWLRKTR